MTVAVAMIMLKQILMGGDADGGSHRGLVEVFEERAIDDQECYDEEVRVYYLQK